MGQLTFPPRTERGTLSLTAQGLIAECFPRAAISGAYPLVTQRLEATMIGLRAGDIVTNVHFTVSTAGTSVTIGRVAVYSKAGVLLSSSSNDTTIWSAAADFRTVALSSAYTVTADDGYYIAALAVFTGTAPQVLRGVSQANSLKPVGSGKDAAVAQTGQADLPGPATFSNSGSAVWFGVS